MYAIQERVEIVKLNFQNNSCVRAFDCLINKSKVDLSVGILFWSLLRHYEFWIKFRIQREVVEIAGLGHVVLDNNQSICYVEEVLPCSYVHIILKAPEYHTYQLKLLNLD